MRTADALFHSSLVAIFVGAIACGSTDATSPPVTAGAAGAGVGGATTGNGGATTGNGGATTGNGGATTGNGGATTGNGGATTGNGGATTGNGGSAGAGGAVAGGAGTGGTVTDGGKGGAGGSAGAGGAVVVPPTDGGACPADFWGDTTNIPAATKVMTFKFINRTNGRIPDSKIFWSLKNNNVDELHSIAEQPTYDMNNDASGRMYFYIVTDPADPLTSATAPRTSKYYDFIEHTIGTSTYNGNTTRVDRWGLKISMRLHCKDGYDIAVGEDCGIFGMTREQVFAQFVAEMPTEFKIHGTINAPYGIPEMTSPPAFKTGGQYYNYMDSWEQELWTSAGIGGVAGVKNCNPIAQPDLSAACYRHVGVGFIGGDGKVKQGMNLWGNASNPADHAKFYPTPPGNYYAKFWHDHGLLKRAYGFPYDDVGGWSSYVSHGQVQWLIIAIGF